jgi:hypothetical protein
MTTTTTTTTLNKCHRFLVFHLKKPDIKETVQFTAFLTDSAVAN